MNIIITFDGFGACEIQNTKQPTIAHEGQTKPRLPEALSITMSRLSGCKELPHETATRCLTTGNRDGPASLDYIHTGASTFRPPHIFDTTLIRARLGRNCSQESVWARLRIGTLRHPGHFPVWQGYRMRYGFKCLTTWIHQTFYQYNKSIEDCSRLPETLHYGEPSASKEQHQLPMHSLQQMSLLTSSTLCLSMAHNLRPIQHQSSKDHG